MSEEEPLCGEDDEEDITAEVPEDVTGNRLPSVDGTEIKYPL